MRPLHFALVATCLFVSLGCGCGEPAPSISVQCTHALGDVTINCDGDQIVGDGSSVDLGSGGSGGDGATPICKPAVLPLVGPWIQDQSGKSSYGSFIVPPTDEHWRFEFVLPLGRILTRIEVPVKPQAVPPSVPALPAAFTLFKGNVLSNDFELVGETSDDPSAPEYGGQRTIAIDGLHEVGVEDGLLYSARLQAPVDNDDKSALVVLSSPYATFGCD